MGKLLRKFIELLFGLLRKYGTLLSTVHYSIYS